MILIADVDFTSVNTLASIAETHGYRSLASATGEEAWTLIEKHSPEMVVLSRMLPHVDGLEVCRRIRRSSRLSSTYVIMLTDGHTDAEASASVNAGADDYIGKPFHAAQLCTRLGVAFRIINVNREREQLLASLSSILIGLDAAGTITRWNTAAERAFGLSASATHGKPLSACGVQWTDAARVERLTTAHNAHATHDDLSFRDREGKLRLVGVGITAISSQNGRRPGQVIIGTDITDRRMREMQVRQTQKLEAIGQLAAGIAHEINTPMQFIGDNLRFVGDAIGALEPLFDELLSLRACMASGDLTADSAVAAASRLVGGVEASDLDYLRGDLPAAVAQSLEGVSRVARIVTAMKEFSHPGTGEKTPVDVNDAIETTLVVAKNEYKYVADVELALDTGLPAVPGFVGELHQVFVNLIVNAAHAIADEVHAGRVNRGTIRVTTAAADGRVEIRVTDTGGGIREDIRARVFEPFFTTKEVGRGTGQGLAMAHATIVGRHGGDISFESDLGGGTTFIVRLPTEETSRLAAPPARECALSFRQD